MIPHYDHQPAAIRGDHQPHLYAFAFTVFFGAVLFICCCENLALLTSRGQNIVFSKNIVFLVLFTTALSVLGALYMLIGIAALISCARAMGNNARERLSHYRRYPVAFLSLALTVPFIIIYSCLCTAIFKGEGINARLEAFSKIHATFHPIKFACIVGTCVLLAFITWLILWILIASVRRALQRSSSFFPAALLPLLILILCGAVVWLNCTLALRIYEDIHACLSALCLLASLVSFGLLRYIFTCQKRGELSQKVIVICVSSIGVIAILILFFYYHRMDSISHQMAERNHLQAFIITRTQRLLKFARLDSYCTLLPRAEDIPPSRSTGEAYGPHPQMLHHILPQGIKWNVLLIMIDSVRADILGCYGKRPSPSPRIDLLAARGVVFRRCYTSGTFTGSSLPALFTSSPIPFILDRNPKKDFSSLVNILRGEGYATYALYGFNCEGARSKVTAYSAVPSIIESFDEYACQANRDLQDETLRHYLAKCSRTEERPFFIYWHMRGPRAQFEMNPFSSRDHILRGYAAELSGEDRRIEQALQWVNELSLADHTIVIISSDHGEEILDHGALYHGTTVYNEQIHVPLIMVAPGLQPRTVVNPVAAIDIMPTLLDLLNISTDYPMYGRSLVPAMMGRSMSSVPIFSFAASHYWSITGEKWKLIWDRPLGFVELYNLADDPHELNNLANEQQGRTQEMKDKIKGLYGAGLIKGGLGYSEVESRAY